MLEKIIGGREKTIDVHIFCHKASNNSPKKYNLYYVYAEDCFVFSLINLSHFPDYGHVKGDLYVAASFYELKGKRGKKINSSWKNQTSYRKKPGDAGEAKLRYLGIRKISEKEISPLIYLIKAQNNLEAIRFQIALDYFPPLLSDEQRAVSRKEYLRDLDRKAIFSLELAIQKYIHSKLVELKLFSAEKIREEKNDTKYK